METNLLTTCGIAFAAVLAILGALAAVIRLLTLVFPDRSPESDSAMMEAIAQAVGQAFPGARVTAVETERPAGG